MKNNGTVYIIYLGLCAALAAYFFFTDTDKAAAGDEADLALALLGGGRLPEGAENLPPPDSGSILDSTFGTNNTFNIPDEGGAESTGDGAEPDILEPVSADNPINPATGERYPDSVMRVFDQLHQKFPNNSLIPRRQSPEDRRREDEERNRVFGLQSFIAQGTASNEQVNQYYDYQSRGVKDRLELINYVLENKGGEMSDDIRAQYERIKTMSEDQLKGFDAQRQMALQRTGGAN